MKMAAWVAEFSVRRRGLVVATTLLLTASFAVFAALPSIWPQSFPSLHGVQVDTDPENMLSSEEPARLFHDKTRELFQLHDMVVVGVVDEEHPEGVFNPTALANVFDLSNYAKTLRWQDDHRCVGKTTTAKTLALSGSTYWRRRPSTTSLKVAWARCASNG